MPVCINCGFDNLEGEIFCTKCGVALAALSLSTKKLGGEDDTLSAGSETLSADQVVMLHFDDFDDPLAIQVSNPTILGRVSGDVDGTLAVSLETFRASEQGVSRYHAKLVPEGHQLYIRDLGSTNHTFLNGERLADERDYALRDGDNVSLGRLKFKIFFK